MEQHSSTTHDLALLIFSCEVGEGSDLSERQSAVRRTFDTLNVHLSTRLGSAGYQALLKRAVSLAVKDLPWLVSVQIAADGTLEGFQARTEAQSVSEGCVAILTRLLDLLDTFIGRTLTLRVLHSGWPHMAATDMGSNEKSEDQETSNG